MMAKLRGFLTLMVIAWAVGALTYRITVGARLKPALEGRIGENLMVEKVHFHDWFLMSDVRHADIEVSRDVSNLSPGGVRGIRREVVALPVEILGRWFPGTVKPGPPQGVKPSPP